ncbi:hypothetical protein [Nocardiopsis sp. NPDC006938]|uniref:hypothetical protein n=1 Tax=Nocardiopsis sp. NPDC006938 TaxID=3364337 RepID=UPI0036BAFD57
MKRIIAALISLPLAFSLVSASPSMVGAVTKAEMECREYLSKKGYVVGEKSRTACRSAKTNIALCRHQLEELGVSEAHFRRACGAHDVPKPDPWAG